MPPVDEPAIAPAWSPPAQFAEYRLIRRLGEGGMGQVWIALDTVLDRRVAVKFLSAELERSPGAHERFLLEARAAARLQHPNVVTVYRIGALGHRPYIVSELIDGTPLSQLERPLSSARVLELGLGLARGLAAAHRRGVLHRDLKPANAILADDGQVKLLDFGLAKLLERPAPATTGDPGPPPPTAIAVTVAMGSPGADPLAVGGAATTPLPAPVGTPPPIADAIALAADEPRGALTGFGVVMGTPYYMPPETWLGEPATRASDVYALGVVLYELCAGRPPHAGVAVGALGAVVVSTDVPPLAVEVPGVEPRLAAVIDRCLLRDPAGRYATGEDLLLALEAVRTLDLVRTTTGNPYRGLYRFEADHRGVFFGRATEIRAVVERVKNEALIVVAGDSGVGKSSLCRAGVLPTVLDEGVGDGRAWTAVRLVPGQRPMTALVAALALPTATSPDSTVVLGGVAPDQGEPAVGSPWGSHAQLVRQVVVARRGRGLIVFVDQLEELVTLAEPAEAADAAQLLAELGAGVPGIRVLTTARCDFLTRLSGLPALGPAIARGLYLLRPMAIDALREAVLGPARATGVAFDPPALVDELAADAAAAEGGLPLLQFTLGELWDAHDRERHAITRAVVERVGGTRGALTRHADGVVAALLPGQRLQARAVLMRLVSGAGIRARRTEAELTHGEPGAGDALAALVRGRLVAAQAGEPEAVFEVAHEALLSEWRTLRDWLDERADQRLALERLADATREWLRLDRTRELLWGERALADAELVPTAELSADQRGFLTASRREQLRRRWRVRILAAAIVAAAIAGYLGYRAVDDRARARKVASYVTAGKGELSAARTGAAAIEVLRVRAFATFDGGDRAGGETLWTEVMAQGDQVAATYRAASRSFEAAVTVDHTAARARTLLADTLYERALIAERERHDSDRDEALERLRLYDDGHRLAAWAAPATVTLTTTPPGAQVRLAAVVPRAGKAELGAWRDLGATPLAVLPLPAGSYVFELTLAGRAPTRYPVLLGRGEPFSADVPLIAAARVPTDMIYVPPGRFTFGSTAPDHFRTNYLKAVPPHARTTGAFLVSRFETTYARWTRFLAALPPDEAVRRAPASGSDGAPGFVRLVPDGHGWRLTLQPATERYDLLLGAELSYRHRPAEAPHPSDQLPVTGIGPADVEAYVAWLDRTGAVPGARLCGELEWERTARGADARTYAHGDVLTPDDANYGEGGSDYAGYGPDAVGRHPASRSVFGADDLVGNAWEFARSAFAETRYVVRGGGYPLDDQAAMSTMRDVVHEALRDVSIGFRVCADAEPAR